MKRTTLIRAREEDVLKIKNLAREISFVQRSDIKTPELIRRTFNIPNLKDVLMEDAKLKKELKRLK